MVFLKHLLGSRPVRIVPVLAGLGAHQAEGRTRGATRAPTRFLEGVRALVEARPGPRRRRRRRGHGARGPALRRRGFDEGQRAALEQTDRASLERATALDAEGFWAHVARDLDERRVCGLAPIWSLVRGLSGGARGRVLHYEQTMDQEDGSIVSHAAVGFYPEEAGAGWPPTRSAMRA